MICDFKTGGSRRGLALSTSGDGKLGPIHVGCYELKHGRAFAASLRAKIAREHLADCKLCAHECGVNRLAGEQGICHAGATARIFSAQIEVSDELELIPTFAIALSGCDLRCAFCITGKESWNPRAGTLLRTDNLSGRRLDLECGCVPDQPQRAEPANTLRLGEDDTAALRHAIDLCSLAEHAVRALENGARTIMILGGEPTIHLPTVLEIVAALPDDAKLIWKTNAHASTQARELLNGIFDVWLADYKFGSDVCAQRLALVPNYNEVVRENLLWANEHSELIVRHLVMPGHVECCWEPIAEWLAENLPGVKVNLRSGFWPAWQARKHAELKGPTTDAETKLASEIARGYALNLIQ